MKKEDFQALSILYIIWLLNLELSPGMGHILIRPNEYGQKKVVLLNIVRYMIEPLKNLDFWRPMMWDVNVYTFMGFGYFFYKSLSFS